MIQEIITYSIVIIAFGWAIKGFFKIFFKGSKKLQTKKKTLHNGCSSCTSACILKDSSSTIGEKCAVTPKRMILN